MATKSISPRTIDCPGTDAGDALPRQRFKTGHSAILSTAILIFIVAAAVLLRGVV